MGIDKNNISQFYTVMRDAAEQIRDEKLNAGIWFVLDYLREVHLSTSSSLPSSKDQILDREQCAVCSSNTFTWLGRPESSNCPVSSPTKYYSCCSCSFGQGANTSVAMADRRERARNKFSDEALSSNPDVAVAERRLKEKHQKERDKLNNKLAETAAREIDTKHKVNALQAEVSALRAAKSDLQAELDDLRSTNEAHLSDQNKTTEQVIEVPIKLRIKVDCEKA